MTLGTWVIKVLGGKMIVLAQKTLCQFCTQKIR